MSYTSSAALFPPLISVPLLLVWRGEESTQKLSFLFEVFGKELSIEQIRSLTHQAIRNHPQQWVSRVTVSAAKSPTRSTWTRP